MDVDGNMHRLRVNPDTHKGDEYGRKDCNLNRYQQWNYPRLGGLVWYLSGGNAGDH